MNLRRGVTLVELLVVLAIIGVLLALVVPAVQRSRAAAARLECANNLKQIGLAAHGYHDSQRSLPPGMRWKNGKDSMLMSTWLVQLLPYIEQDALWNSAVAAYQQSPTPKSNPPHAAMSTAVRTYGCPADGRVSNVQLAPVDKVYVGLTSYLGVSGWNWSTVDGLLFRDSRIRLAEVVDGTSNTLLAGERPPSADFQFGWWYAGVGQQFTGSADMVLGVYEQNLQPVKPGSCPPGFYPFMPGRFNNQCDMFHFWSPHSGGAHFLFADGSVRFLNYDAASILPALASRAGGESVSLP